MKGVLLFIAGLLVGANIVYFVMRGPPAPIPVPEKATQAPGTSADSGQLPAVQAIKRGVSIPDPVIATPALPTPASIHSASTALLLPVAGIRPSQLQDTYADARVGGVRVHDALDIMAPRGTPVLAAVDGTVEKLFDSVPGGLTLYEFDADRNRAYYYAHLDRYADGLAEGQQLKRGQVIAYVGSTGNANKDAPHLHFAIFVLGPEKHWWQGTPINPYPLLQDAAVAK
ncbi:MAG: M23 family metallopeptidase [Luteimonas sp.]